MNPFAALLSADPLLEVLVRIALVATAVAALALLAVRCNRRAAMRHALALAGATALLAVPLLVTAAQYIGVGVPLLGAAPMSASAQLDAPAVPAVAKVAAAPANAPLPAAAPTPTPTGETRAPAAAASTAPPLGVLALFLWLAAAGIALAFELRAAHRVDRLRAHCRPLGDPVLAAHAAAAARDLGLGAVPPLLVSDALPCPATIGIRRPVIVLPQALLAPPARSTAAALLRHELAHVALGHPWQSLLQCALRVLFGWHPLAHSLARALGDSQEEVADNAALGGGAEPLAYARALVAFAEQSLHLPRAPQALFARGGRPFTRRIVRLTETHRDLMIRPTARGRALASCLAAAAVLVPLTVRMLPAQSPAAKAGKAGEHSGAAFLPLAEGTLWTWNVVATDSEGKSTPGTSSAQVWGEVPLDANTTCTQVLKDGFVEYWSADDHGIFQHDTEYLSHLRGVNPKARTRLLAAPVGAEARWEWDSMMSYQTLGDAPPRDPEDDRIHHVAELLGVDDEVAVPAGKFRCAHVRITSTNRHWQVPEVHDLWFGRGTGLVRDTDTGPSGAITRELAAFTVGKAVARDPAAALNAWLGTAAQAQTKRKVEWVAGGELAFWLHGRFAVVWLGEHDARALYVDDRATEFDPRNTKFWNERRQEQQQQMDFRWGVGTATPAGGVQATLSFPKALFQSHNLVPPLAQIEMMRRGLVDPSASSMEITTDRVQYTAQAKDANGKEVAVQATMTFTNGVITGAEVTVKPGHVPSAQQEQADPHFPPLPGGGR